MTSKLLNYCIPISVLFVICSLIVFRFAMKSTLERWLEHPFSQDNVAHWYLAQRMNQMDLPYDSKYTKSENQNVGIDVKVNYTNDVHVKVKTPKVVPTFGTLADKSFYNLVQDKTEYKRGDIIHLRLETADARGRHRSRGGDFWYATMGSQDRNFLTAGRVTDYKNGSYSVYFYAGYQGYMNINITLVYKAESIDWLEKVYRPSERCVTWKGFYKNDSISETTECVVERHTRTNFDRCEYSDPEVLGQTLLVCEKPRELSCDHLTYMESKDMGARVHELLGPQDYLYDKSNLFVPIRGSPDVLSIQDSLGVPTAESELPGCSAGLHDDKPYGSGYWRDDNWNSLICRNKQYTVKEAQTCLHNKQIYFLGDSTTRQLFLALMGSLGYPADVRMPDQALLNVTDFTSYQDHMRMYYALVQNKELNINATFQFHGLPITGRAKYRVKEPNPDVMFEQHILDALSDDDCKYIVLVSPWAHYVQWTPTSYLERLNLLKKSLNRLKERCSNTIMIIKGSHQRDHRSPDSHIYASDWILYDMNKILRRVFHEDWWIFLDVWDMNLSFLSPWNRPNNVHMPYSVIREELNFLFSHMCQTEQQRLQ
ncbi:NXPE family member 4-like [Glandiceps talaboti]